MAKRDAIVHQPRTAEAVLVQQRPASEHPVAVYLAPLTSVDSRPAMKSSL